MESSSLRAESLARRLRVRPWRLIVDPPGTGDWNMAVDRMLFRRAQQFADPTLRFYSWNPPAFSLGRFQKLPIEAMRRCWERGWDVVRRPTGGRGVLHHLEVTYSITLPPDLLGPVGLRETYSVLSGSIALALETVFGLSLSAKPEQGVRSDLYDLPTGAEENCFARVEECDISAEGAKLVGSAQARSRGAVLQHGSILLDVDEMAWTEIFGSAGRVTGLSHLLKRSPTWSEVTDGVAAEFARVWDVEFALETLNPAERAMAEELQARFRLSPVV